MLNIQGLMKQAQMMQKKMQEAQEKLAQTEVSGSSANGLLTVTLNGKSEMKKISIDKSLASDDVEMLEDLIMVAVNEAIKKADDASASAMSKMTGGMGGGFPF